MRKFNALAAYPQPREPRIVGNDLRNINHRIVATYKGKDFYDGDRNFGYGGYHYDGRWIKVAESMISNYGLNSNSKVLQVGCEKGFLLHDLKNIIPTIHVSGTETSDYAAESAMASIKGAIAMAPPTALPFEDSMFDLVIVIGSIYTLNLADAIKALREIERVTRVNSFITLASYRNESDLSLFRKWSLLGTTVLTERDWITVLEHTGYTGDYYFTSADSLCLQNG